MMEKFGIGVAVILLALFLGWVIVYIAVDLNGQARCLRLGYASHGVTGGMTTYCIREENEYEITVPLSELG